MEIYTYPTQWQWFYEPFFLNSFEIGGQKYSSLPDITVINLNAESNGKIPQGIAAICLQLGARDSGSSSGNCWVNLHRDSSSLYVLQRSIGTYNGVGPALPDNTWSQEQGIVPCDNDGNISFRCQSTGEMTLDISIIVVGFAATCGIAPKPPQPPQPPILA
jgi:hypothetical protein